MSNKPDTSLTLPFFVEEYKAVVTARLREQKKKLGAAAGHVFNSFERGYEAPISYEDVENALAKAVQRRVIKPETKNAMEPTFRDTYAEAAAGHREYVERTTAEGLVGPGADAVAAKISELAHSEEFGTHWNSILFAGELLFDIPRNKPLSYAELTNVTSNSMLEDTPPDVVEGVVAALVEEFVKQGGTIPKEEKESPTR